MLLLCQNGQKLTPQNERLVSNSDGMMPSAMNFAKLVLRLAAICDLLTDLPIPLLEEVPLG